MNVMGSILFQNLIGLIFTFSSFLAFAQEQVDMQINHFLLKETLLKNDKLAIIASDSLDNPKEYINGTFQFTINGFSHSLNFNNGVAITSSKIEHSTFVFVKHSNDTGTHSNLYYILKKDHNLQIYKISWFLLLIIPAALLVLVMMFKRFIWIAILLLLGYLYFSYQNGLNFIDFLEAIVHGIKNWLP